MNGSQPYMGIERRLARAPQYRGRERRLSDWTAAWQEEQSLIQQAIGSDRSAFQQLYDRSVDRIFKYCYYRTGNSTESEDLTLQVYLDAWREIPRHASLSPPFETWLFAIADRLIGNRSDRPRAVLPLPTFSGMPGPVEIRTALEYLQEAEQKVVILRFLEGYSVTQVVRILGTSPETVRRLQCRALRRLWQILSNRDQTFE